MDYLNLLRDSAAKAGNIACMGLDPVLSSLPYEGEALRTRIVRTFSEIFEEMSAKGIRVAAFKPNLGYYSRYDRPLEGCFEGSLALADVLRLLRKLFPDTPVILDSKRGDIATSSLNYAVEAFDVWKADCVTVSPYMGTDSVMPFAFEGKGMYILNRTSNPGAAVIQNCTMAGGGMLYGEVASRIAAWSEEHKGTGAVVGATNMKELEDIVAFYAGKDIPVLIPGVGSQGGSAPDVMAALRKAGYDVTLARINSSSGLTHPWKKNPVPADWLEKCIANIARLAEETRL